MSHRFAVERLALPGFVLEHIEVDGDTLLLLIRPRSQSGRCPVCNGLSGRVHSSYLRQPCDLPAVGRRVRLQIRVRRFRCTNTSCSKHFFSERFATDVLECYARRTARLDCLVHHLGLALGGRPAARFANRLMLPVSNDTLLRTVRRRTAVPNELLTVAGIDDFAWRRNFRYGTIVCDLERRRTVALLPDREPSTAQAWLSAHQSIQVIARDRGGGYGEAAAKALPHALQVADRWHLMENASTALLNAVRNSMKQIRTVLGAVTINPALLTSAERLRYEGYLRREATNDAIIALSKAGAPIREIVRKAGHSRNFVRRILRGQRSDIFRTRQNSLEIYLPWLDDQWEAGNRNAADLWRRLKAQGFKGCLRVVGEWAGRRQRAERADDRCLQCIPSARTIAHHMTTGRDHLTKSEAITIAALEEKVPALVEARSLTVEFQSMIRAKSEGQLAPWLARASQSLIASFARGILSDEAAVRAAIASPWSNGQTEGQITKLKLVKRQMYGRANIDLLQARVIASL